jgi:RNA polymerase sigma factor (sigma-70 family)
MDHLMGKIRRMTGAPRADGQTDGELLERFAAQHEQSAFELLLQRHGPMVLNVCRRVLQNLQDSEDAFQATFLVLLRKAASIAGRELLGNWLYGVAYRTALKARAIATRRKTHESQVPAMETTEMKESAAADRDDRLLLNEEVNRLPEKFRAPIVCCYLQGKTTEEAAEQFGCPKGTVLWRLSRGRDLLRDRLTRRGLALSTGMVATVLADKVASAAVPSALVDTTLMVAHVLVTTGKATTAGVASANVSALTEGVLQAMFMTKLKIAAALLVACFVLTGSGWAVHQALAEKPAVPAAAIPAQPVAAQPELPSWPAQFTQLQTLIKPRADESQVEQVPWITFLWEARLKAAAEGKPIFIWAAGGPPGGC